MAEIVGVLGLISSIISVVNLSAKIVSWINEFAAQSSEIPASFCFLADRLPLLTQTLQRIQARVRAGLVQSFAIRDLDNLVSHIFNQIELIQRHLDKISPTTDASKIQRVIKALRSLAKDDKIRVAVDQIRQDIELLILHQAASNVEISEDIRAELAQLNIQRAPASQALGLCLGQAPQIAPDAFIGRQSELQQLHRWLSPQSSTDPQRVVSIVGIGGLGKTQLSIQYARKYHFKYSSVIWLDARDKSSLRQSLSSYSAIIFPDDINVVHGIDEEKAQVEKIRRWLSESWNTRWLLIFDNYDDLDLPGARSLTGFDVRSFFPIRVHGSILITTRSPKLTYSRKLMLRKLDHDTSTAVLSQRSRRDLLGESDLKALAVRLDGLPLALATAGTYLERTGLSSREYLHLYDTAWADLNGPDAKELLEYEDRTLATTWNISYDHVRDQDLDAAELFRFLAYLSNRDIRYELIKAAANDDTEASWLIRIVATRISFDRAMTKLRDASLVVIEHGTYGLHTCVRDWIWESYCVRSNEYLFLLALRCVLNNIPLRTSSYYWTTSRQLLDHILYLWSERFQAKWKAHALDTVVLSASLAFGDVCKEWSRLYLAEQMYQGALNGYKITLGLEHAQTLIAADKLGISYEEQGKFIEAEQTYSRVLAAREKVLGPDDVSTLSSLNDLGVICMLQGKLSESESMYLRALAGREKVLGPEHESSLQTCNNLGILYRAQGNLPASERMFQRALIGHEKLQGPEHVSVLDVVYNLAILYRIQDDLAAAERMFRRALAGREKALGAEHAATLSTMNNFGMVLKRQGRLMEAEEMLSRALAGKEKILGSQHSSTLHTVYNMGLIYWAQDKLAEAERMFERVTASYQRSTLPQSPTALDAVHALGRLQWDQGKLEPAAKTLERAVAERTAFSGPQHAMTRKIVRNLDELRAQISSQSTAT